MTKLTNKKYIFTTIIAILVLASIVAFFALRCTKNDVTEVKITDTGYATLVSEHDLHFRYSKIKAYLVTNVVGEAQSAIW